MSTFLLEGLLLVSLLFSISIGILLGYVISESSKKMQNLGIILYRSKIKLLYESRTFEPLRELISQGRMMKASFFLFAFISFKSFGMFIISFVLIVPFLLPLQGVMMGSLIAHYKKNHNLKAILSITFWQLMSHILASIPGTVIAYNWLMKDHVFYDVIMSYNKYWQFLVLSLLSAMLASFFEAREAASLLIPLDEIEK